MGTRGLVLPSAPPLLQLMELSFRGEAGFPRAASSTGAKRVPATSSPLHGLWRGPAELQHLVSSQNQQRGIYSVKVTKLHGLEASASLLESLTIAIHWNMFKAVGMSKALTPNLMGEKNMFGTKFACYVN